MTPNNSSRQDSGNSDQNSAPEGIHPQQFNSILREENDENRGSPDTVRRVRPGREGREDRGSGGTYGMRISIPLAYSY